MFPRDVVCLRNMSVDTLHKGDTKDDDDDDDDNNNNNKQVIIGATGTISKSFKQYLSNIQGKHEIKEIQKKKQLYWALHTYCGKCYCESTKHI